jgi:hypothetical protein
MLAVKSKNEVAQELATFHAEVEQSVVRVIRLRTNCEDDPNEPIKLLELNRNTIASGIVPVYFGPSDEVPYPSVVVEVTESEFVNVERQSLKLPEGWRIGEVLYPTPNGELGA